MHCKFSVLLWCFTGIPLFMVGRMSVSVLCNSSVNEQSYGSSAHYETGLAVC